MQKFVSSIYKDTDKGNNFPVKISDFKQPSPTVSFSQYSYNVQYYDSIQGKRIPVEIR